MSEIFTEKPVSEINDQNPEQTYEYLGDELIGHVGRITIELAWLRNNNE